MGARAKLVCSSRLEDMSWLMDAECNKSSSFKCKGIPLKFFPLATVVASSTFFFLFLLLGLHSHSSRHSCLFCFFGSELCSNREVAAMQPLAQEHTENKTETGLANVVFGIGAASNVLSKRKVYIQSWWRPNETRGFVFADGLVSSWSSELPELRVSESTFNFSYTFKNGRRSALRISRIASEMFRMKLPNVRWFVLGDDDTVFFVDNLIKVLSKYDHTKMYYIGANSESHVQNVRGFSSNMAYGGGGFALSYGLAEALESMQDDCLERYHFLYGSDDRIHACMAELGVPLTKEPGFHQLDIHGDASGILSAHPLAPVVSLHHLNVIQPLFPGMSQPDSLQRLGAAVRADPSGVFQHSICYSKSRNLTMQVSWGYLVHVTKGIIYPKNLEVPLRTFSGWNGERDELGFSFTTRALSRDVCRRPTPFYMVNVTAEGPLSYSRYERRPSSQCFKLLRWIEMEKQQTDESWFKAPRRQCCRIIHEQLSGFRLGIADCKPGELAL